MDNAEGDPSAQVGLLQICLHDTLHITGRHGVQVQDICKFNYSKLVFRSLFIQCYGTFERLPLGHSP